MGIFFGYSTYIKEHLYQISACYHFWLGYNDLRRSTTGLNSSIDSKLRFQSVGLRLYFQAFPNLQRDFGIFECCFSWTSQSSQLGKKRLCFQIVPNSLKSWEIGIFEVFLILYLSDCEDSLSDTVCLHSWTQLF